MIKHCHVNEGREMSETCCLGEFDLLRERNVDMRDTYNNKTS